MARDLSGLETVRSPFKVQGGKERLCRQILERVANEDYARWVEPFAGSCVVGMTERPEIAVFSDLNPFVMQFFCELRDGRLTPDMVHDEISLRNEELKKREKSFYDEVCKRFNEKKDILDYLFLVRTGFNGLSRFSVDGRFTTPYGKRFVTDKGLIRLKAWCETIFGIMNPRWEFLVRDFSEAFTGLRRQDMLYCDPPYYGTAADYYSRWSLGEEERFFEICQMAPCDIIVSSWIEKNGRKNPRLDYWKKAGFSFTEVLRYSGISAKGSARGTFPEVLLCRERGHAWF